MFEYYYRIYDRYKMPTVALVILADRDQQWQPCAYVQDLWGCALTFKYPTVKLVDYYVKWEMLESSKNPVAKVIQAHLVALASRGSLALKFDNKLKLVKNLYTLGYSADDIRQLYEFIDYAISLPANLEFKLLEEIHAFEEASGMRYVTNAERIGMERGIEQGIGRVAKKMMEQSFDFRTIAQVTGLSVKQIEKIQESDAAVVSTLIV